MTGAINVFKKWREICDRHTVKNVSKEIRAYCKCDNCELKFLCVYKKPTQWSDDDILKLVRKLEC